MPSWTVLTPYYSEEVLYSRSELERRNSDGVTTLLYLQTLFRHDWHNFLERHSLTSSGTSADGVDVESVLWGEKLQVGKCL